MPTAANGVVGRPFVAGNQGRPAYSQVDKARAILKELGFDVIREAVIRYRDPVTPSASKDFCLGLIADRVHAKLKAVEVSGSLQETRAVLIEIAAGVAPPPAIVLETHQPLAIEDDQFKADDH